MAAGILIEAKRRAASEGQKNEAVLRRKLASEVPTRFERRFFFFPPFPRFGLISPASDKQRPKMVAPSGRGGVQG